MPTKTISVKISVPDGTSNEVRETAEHQAHEAAVLALWRGGQLTIRQAAEELELTYHEFLDLLAQRGIPVEQGELNTDALAAAAQKLKAGSVR